MSEERKTTHRRLVPQTDLDFSMLTTDSVWGKPEVSMELQEKLKKYYLQKTSDGSTLTVEEGMWGLLGFYTRDMRLANLSDKPWNDELNFVDYHLNLANDLLQAGMTEAFLISLSRVATKLELSQSKGGFLRKRMNTFSQETTHRELEPPKKSLFGASKKKGDFG